MAEAISPKDFDIIKEYIHRVSGIHLPYEKEYLVRQKLEPFVYEQGFADFSAFALAIEQGKTQENWISTIVSAITTKETFFFRDNHPFTTLSEFIIPQLLQDRSHLRAWSAGCSTGQEPYSLAMLFREYQKNNNSRAQFEIVATDIDRMALDYAQKGIYHITEINRGLAEPYLTNYVHQNNARYWSIDPALRDMITFGHHSLHRIAQQNEPPGGNPFDLILARNVLIYFDEKTRKAVLASFFNYLRNGGALLLGSTESLYGQVDYFTTENYDKTIIYKKFQA